MLLHITHKMTLGYSRPVFIEPMLHRLRPRCDCTQQVIDYRTTIDPAPAGGSETVDLDGNNVTWVWFDGLHERLSLGMEATVRTLRTNPFDFVSPAPEADRLPLVYPQQIAGMLEPYRRRVRESSTVDAFAAEAAAEAQGQALTFVLTLCERLYRGWEQQLRPEGDSWTPEETFSRREGACRDLAVLLIDACRSVGLAARFVTGYCAGDTPTVEDHLHAWAEVYVPGGGWRGFDPSLGLAVADQYVALCSAPEPAAAAATEGNFRGTAATSQLQYQLAIRRLDEFQGQPG